MMEIVNIHEENLPIFRTTCGIAMKCLGKMYIMIILKVTKDKGFFLSLKCIVFENPQRVVKISPQHFQG